VNVLVGLGGSRCLRVVEGQLIHHPWMRFRQSQVLGVQPRHTMLITGSVGGTWEHGDDGGGPEKSSLFFSTSRVGRGEAIIESCRHISVLSDSEGLTAVNFAFLTRCR
jgi:hypothetical protein